MDQRSADVKINELDDGQVCRLASKINKTVKNSSTKFWYVIASEIIIHPYYRGVIQTLDQNITDSENWVNYVTQKYPEIDFNRILDITESIGRYDIAVFLRNIACSRNIVRIGDLLQHECSNFGKLLKVKSKYQTIDGWRIYAKKLQFTEEDFNCILQNKVLSCPSSRLLIFCQKIYPDTSLDNIRQICIRYKRFDVIRILENIAIEITNKKQVNGIIIDELDCFGRMY